jgi:hypothetical protein
MVSPKELGKGVSVVKNMKLFAKNRSHGNKLANCTSAGDNQCTLYSPPGDT